MSTPVFRGDYPKQLTPRQATSEKVVLDDVALICELDEL